MRRRAGAATVICVLGLMTSVGLCVDSESQRLGEALGESLVSSAEDVAETKTRAVPECDPPYSSPELEKMCDRAQRTVEILLKVQDAIEHGRVGKEQKYEDTYDYHMFAALKYGLRSSSNLIRWHVLTNIFGACDEPSALSALGKKECGREVESACMETLKSDTDPMNRQLALEILGMGYAGIAAKPVLEQIAAASSGKGSRCPRIFDQEKKGDAQYLKQIEEGYAKGLYSCEVELASEAIKSIKSKVGRRDTGK